MAVTNDKIYRKLQQMHKEIKELKDEESVFNNRIINEESKIMVEEAKLIKLLDKDINLQFENIIDWKNYIWDTCPYRKAIEKNKEIDFICKKTHNKCRFDDCFRNRRK